MECAVSDCDFDGKLRKGLCTKHYTRLRARGTTDHWCCSCNAAFPESKFAGSRSKVCLDCTEARRRSERERLRLYQQSPQGRAYQQAWRKTAKGRAAELRYVRSDKFRASLRRYHQSSKGKESLKRGRNKRRAAVTVSSLTAAEWAFLREQFGGVCAYCVAAPGDTQDHVVPLVKGGQHEVANVVPACRSCNASKHAREVREWMLTRGFDYDRFTGRREDAARLLDAGRAR